MDRLALSTWSRVRSLLACHDLHLFRSRQPAVTRRPDQAFLDGAVDPPDVDQVEARGGALPLSKWTADNHRCEWSLDIAADTARESCGEQTKRSNGGRHEHGTEPPGCTPNDGVMQIF